MHRVNYFLKRGRKTLWVVEIDGVVLGVLPQDKLFTICQKVGSITDEQESDLQREALTFAKDRLLSYLGYRERSRKQAYQYLVRLPLDLRLASELIEQMQEWHFLSQERFAYSFARSLRAKNIAKELVRSRLAFQDVEYSLREKVLRDVYRNDSFVAEQAVQCAVRKYSRLPATQMKRKCLAWLHRRGFRFEQIAVLLGQEIARAKE